MASSTPVLRLEDDAAILGSIGTVLNLCKDLLKTPKQKKMMRASKEALASCAASLHASSAAAAKGGADTSKYLTSRRKAAAKRQAGGIKVRVWRVGGAGEECVAWTRVEPAAVPAPPPHLPARQGVQRHATGARPKSPDGGIPRYRS